GVWPLIDEPASGLDAAGRRAVGSYLASQRGFVLVSHDRYLLDSCVDHLLAIGPAGLTLERGDYSSWLANRDKREAFEASRRQKLSKEAERLAEAARRSTEWSSRAESGKFGAGPVDRGFIGHKAAKLQRRAKSQEKRLHKALEEKKALSFAPEKPGALTWRPLASPKRLLASGRNLTLAYQERPVLRGLDFDLAAGERLALLGPNGCGKSLLMSLFLGQARILRGEFSRPASLIISYAPQIPIFPSPTFSRLAQEWGLAESRFKAVLNYLGFDKRHFETELASLSQGQKKKVFLAASLMREAHLYLWDEPLDHLDLESREQLEELILSDGPSLVVVEHDQRFLERVATRSLDLTPFSQTVAENEFA
ncbi:MAG: ATP-binding cassette domain-containing protein, partial [Deltaproteobacteria bacterium]|nr:ATP-binding cassette domain-containing protein [Deltaproteobacteria bacterium]